MRFWRGDPTEPTSKIVVATPFEQLLLDLEPGEERTIMRVSDRDPEQLRYLGGLGLFPGVFVTVLERLPFEGPIRIRIDGAEHVIGRPLAAAVHVGDREDE